MKNKFSIDIDNSINSGQVFLWEKDGTDWYGINGQDILKINKNGVKYQTFILKQWKNYRNMILH